MSAQTATIERPVESTEYPDPIRIIRKVNGVYQWAYVLPAELTEAECRAIHVAAFGIYE